MFGLPILLPQCSFISRQFFHLALQTTLPNTFPPYQPILIP